LNRNRFFCILLISLVLVCFRSNPVFSNEPAESDEAKNLSALVDKAASMVESKGKDFFPELRKKDGDWWKGDLYIFVDGMDGTILVHPPDTAIEGQNLLKDPKAKAVAESLIQTAKKGSGWAEYMWPKPGESTPSKKMSYVKQVTMPDKTVVIVGAGMYVK
jgi:cytochrome c